MRTVYENIEQMCLMWQTIRLSVWKQTSTHQLPISLQQFMLRAQGTKYQVLHQ